MSPPPRRGLACLPACLSGVSQSVSSVGGEELGLSTFPLRASRGRVEVKLCQVVRPRWELRQARESQPHLESGRYVIHALISASGWLSD